MVQMVFNSLAAARIPAEELFELGLRVNGHIADSMCQAADQVCSLHLEASRSLINDSARATTQFLAGEAAGSIDPALAGMREAVAYWRSLMGVVASLQADGAAIAESGLHEITGLMERSGGRLGDIGPAALPVAAWNAAGASALASLATMCQQIGHGARRFAADSGIDEALAEATAGTHIEGRQHHPHAHRKAA